MLADDDIRGLLDSRLPELRPDVEAELERVLTRAGSRTRRRRAAYVGGLVAAVVATGLVLGHDWRPRADAPDPVDRTPVRHLVNRGVYSDPASLEPGRYVAQLLGTRDFPGVRVAMDIPSGWGQDSWFAVATGSWDDDATSRIDLFADVERLVRPGCHAAADINGDAQAFVDALSALPGASEPESVTVDDRSGQRIRLEALPGKDRPSCAGAVVLREHSLGIVQAGQSPGWSSIIWVFDVDDHLAVVAASHGPDVTPAEEQELVGIVESLSFVLP